MVSWKRTREVPLHHRYRSLFAKQTQEAEWLWSLPKRNPLLHVGLWYGDCVLGRTTLSCHLIGRRWREVRKPQFWGLHCMLEYFADHLRSCWWILSEEIFQWNKYQSFCMTHGQEFTELEGSWWGHSWMYYLCGPCHHQATVDLKHPIPCCSPWSNYRRLHKLNNLQGQTAAKNQSFQD
jgi:hypothetical protein